MEKSKVKGFLEFLKDEVLPIGIILYAIDLSLSGQQVVNILDTRADFTGGYEAVLKPIGNPGFGLIHNYTPLRWTKNHQKIVGITEEVRIRIMKLQSSCDGEVTVEIEVSPFMGDVGKISTDSEIRCK